MWERVPDQTHPLNWNTADLLPHLCKDVEIISTSGLFDEKWYLQKYIDVAMVGMVPIEHYLLVGSRLGRKPSAGFDPVAYLAAHKDVAKAGMDPLMHYIKFGRKEGRRLSAAMPNRSAGTDGPPAEAPKDKDYSTVASSSLFDRAWYAATYKDAVGDEDPIAHYLRIGATLGFDPGPNFSTSLYIDAYRDVKSAKVNPLSHYIKSGYREGRLPKPAPRLNRLGLVRFTPEERGTPQTLLNFDAPPIHVPGIESERIAIHLHLFFTDTAEEIVHGLRNLRHPFTLLVSVQESENSEHWTAFFRKRLPCAAEVVVRTVANRGRDVAPWVVGFADLIRESTLFCHIHSKRSHHNKSHSGWFSYLLHTMLGSIGVVDGILKIFADSPKVGVVAPCYFWTLADQPNYGRNREIVGNLYARLSGGNVVPDECPDYPAGSFFWVRTPVLKPLFDLNLLPDDFAEERGQIDNTVAHAVERVMGLLPAVTGKELHLVTVDVAYDLTRFVNVQRKRLAHAVKVTPKPLLPPRGRIAVYSCVSGSYEEITPLATNTEGSDFFLFTDDAEAKVPEGHHKRFPNYINPAPVRTARYVKTHPHVWFRDYDYAFWCDSNIHFFGDFSVYANMLDEADADCGFIAHPVRETFLEEGLELIEKRIVDRTLAEAQMARYSNSPAVLSSRLIETNFFICRPRSPKVAKFMGLWWAEINRFTHRDQLSINYALHQAGIKWINIIPVGYSARCHPDFALFAHQAKDRSRVIEFIRDEAYES